MSIKKILKETKAYDFYLKLRRKKILKQRNKAIHSNGLEIISLLSKKISTDLFVDYGTLLGIIRDKKIIDWDDDIDLGIFIDSDFTWNGLESIMNSFGFIKKHEFIYKNEITEQNYKSNYISIDFFRHYEKDGYSISYVYDKDFNNKSYPSDDSWDVMEFKTPAIKKINYINLNGFEIPVPGNAEDYLASVYGDEWRIPNPNWHTGDGPATTKLDGEYAKAIFL